MRNGSGGRAARCAVLLGMAVLLTALCAPAWGYEQAYLYEGVFDGGSNPLLIQPAGNGRSYFVLVESGDKTSRLYEAPEKKEDLDLAKPFMTIPGAVAAFKITADIDATYIYYRKEVKDLDDPDWQNLYRLPLI